MILGGKLIFFESQKQDFWGILQHTWTILKKKISKSLSTLEFQTQILIDGWLHSYISISKLVYFIHASLNVSQTSVSLTYSSLPLLLNLCVSFPLYQLKIKFLPQIVRSLNSGQGCGFFCTFHNVCVESTLLLRSNRKSFFQRGILLDLL